MRPTAGPRALRAGLPLVTLLGVLALVATACGGGGSSSSSGGTSTTEKVAKGGTLVLGAEQEPDCADWFGSCGGSTWGVYIYQQHVMPNAYTVNNDAKLVPTSLLTGEAKLEAGPPMKLTYAINPAAVWSDGQPITSTDFKYTWDQVANGKDIYDRTGYEKITAVDDSDPHTAVVTFKEPYADWKTLFGGFYGVLPSHLLQGKDRDTEMKDGYKWSGGPWMLDHWTKGQELKLVPNPKYWGDKPNLDGVVFKFITDTAAEQQAYKTGQVAAIFPQPQIELAALKNEPNTKFDAYYGFDYEAIWMNDSKPPLTSKAVRQALAYATDRDAIVQQLFGPVKSDIKPIDAWTTPINTPWYKPSYAKYKLDLKMVDQLMTGDGWKKGADGIWAKGGKKASLQISSTAGNKRRELMEQVLQSQWKAAGFDLTTNNTKAGTLFGEWLPQGNYQLSIYAQTPTDPDPGQCVNFCSKNIPSAANKNSGTNWVRINDPQLDKVWLQVDTELDQAKRVPLVQQGYDIAADVMPALPVDPFPHVLVYNTTKIHGPVAENPIYGMYWHMENWYCSNGAC